MAHRILTCRNHPELRWSTKEQAWFGFYTGERKLFFNGCLPGKPYSDGSGYEFSRVNEEGNYISECNCPVSDLILSPEDSIIFPQQKKKEEEWIKQRDAEDAKRKAMGNDAYFAPYDKLLKELLDEPISD